MNEAEASEDSFLRTLSVVGAKKMVKFGESKENGTTT
jgi:hypothetical protein